MANRPDRIPAPQKSARRSLGTARRRTQAERTEETRTRILKAASELIRRRGYAPADAQYLTQSFFEFFLRNKAYARTDRLQGKFRSSLLACVKYFLSENASFDIRNSVGCADRDKIAIVARL